MCAKLAIVILNYNTERLLEEFLPSVVKNSSGCEIVFADNGSTDNSVEYVKTRFPQIRTLSLGSNYGFTGGYNRALKEVSADYYCLLNSDVQVTEGWTRRPLEIMEQNPNIAACQPKLLSYRDKTRFEYAGAAGGFIDKYGYPFCAGRIFGTTEEDLGQYDTEREVFWASGAALFIRSGLYHRFGGLDEGFFAHMEEIDLCWRLKNAGYKICYTPLSTVYHLGGGTLSQLSPRKTYFNFRNNLLLLTKNLPDAALSKVMRQRFWFDMLALAMFVLKLDFKNVKALLRARKDYKRMRKTYLQKRERIDAYPSCVFHSSIVLKSKLQAKKRFSDLEF